MIPTALAEHVALARPTDRVCVGRSAICEQRVLCARVRKPPLRRLGSQRLVTQEHVGLRHTGTVQCSVTQDRSASGCGESVRRVRTSEGGVHVMSQGGRRARVETVDVLRGSRWDAGSRL